MQECPQRILQSAEAAIAQLYTNATGQRSLYAHAQSGDRPQLKSGLGLGKHINSKLLEVQKLICTKIKQKFQHSLGGSCHDKVKGEHNDCIMRCFLEHNYGSIFEHNVPSPNRGMGGACDVVKYYYASLFLLSVSVE